MFINNSPGIIYIEFFILPKVLFKYERKGIQMNINPKATNIINI